MIQMQLQLEQAHSLKEFASNIIASTLDNWRGYLYTEINLVNSEEKTFFHYSDLY